jgi:hypothetical protein
MRIGTVPVQGIPLPLDNRVNFGGIKETAYGNGCTATVDRGRRIWI